MTEFPKVQCVCGVSFDMLVVGEKNLTVNAWKLAGSNYYQVKCPWCKYDKNIVEVPADDARVEEEGYL